MGESRQQVTLYGLLSVHLVLLQTVPYLPLSSLLRLSTTSKNLNTLIHTTPAVFRHLDLSHASALRVNIAPIDPGGETWRRQRMDEACTEEDFYCGPVRGVFDRLRRRRVLRDVQTLVLDGQSAPVEVLREIVCADGFSVRLLSLLGCKNVNDMKFQQMLRYACRPTRPEGSPTVRGIYYFSTAEEAERDRRAVKDGVGAPAARSVGRGIMDAPGAQLGASSHLGVPDTRSSPAGGAGPMSNGEEEEVLPIWYRKRTFVTPRSGTGYLNIKPHEWPKTLRACEGIIAFDWVLCRGPAHSAPTTNDAGQLSHEHTPPRIARFGLGQIGCESCGTVPEGAGVAGRSPTSHVPLIYPPPLHSSSVARAQLAPGARGPIRGLPFMARCYDCVADRHCSGCLRFWCESCYAVPDSETMKTAGSTLPAKETGSIKVYLGYCVDRCLVDHLRTSSGEGGMWG